MQVQYKNVKGEIIASALTGSSPANLIALTAENDTAPLWQSGNIINATFINTYLYPDTSVADVQTPCMASLPFNKTIVSTGENYTITYETEGERWTSGCDSNICFDCIYQLQLALKNLCGDEFFSGNPVGWIDTVGVFNLNDSASMFSCDSSQANVNLTLDTVLPTGSYTLEKILKLDENAMEHYFQLWLKKDTCLKTLQDFVNENLAALDTSVCDLDCESCRDTLSSDTTGIAALNDSICQQDCSDDGNDWCNSNYLMLLSDVSPGGQYAQYKTYTDIYGKDFCWAQQFPLSVFNTHSELPVEPQLVVLYPNLAYRMRYTTPAIWKNGNFQKGYFNKNNERDTLWLDCPAANVSPCKDMVRNITDIKFSSQEQQFYIFPEDLTILEFVNRFNPEWAKSLVVYHPEFIYWKWCSGLYSEKKTVAGQTLNTYQYDSYLLNLPRDSANFLNLLNPMANDPFFQPGATGTNTVFQEYTTPFWWGISNSNCNLNPPQWIPQDKLTTKMNFFADTLSIWQAAYLSYRQCDSTSIPLSMAGLIPNDSTWQLLITMYIGQKNDMLQRIAHAYADSNLRLNTCIGDKDYDFYKSWKQLSYFYSCAPFAQMYSSWMSYPAYNAQNICGEKNYFLYKNKIKRFGTAQELLGLPDAAQGDSLLEMLENNSDAGYYQLTGNCPLTASFLSMLAQLAHEKKLLSNLTLSTCNFASPKLLALFSVPTPDWKPTTDASGKILTANIISGTDSCLVKLSIPTGNNFQWTDSIASIEKVSVLGKNNGLVSFKILVNFFDTAIHSVYVDGQTCLPIDTCSFKANCNLSPVASELPLLLNTLMEQGWLPADTVFIPDLPSEFVNILDSNNFYLWNRSSGKITNPASGKSISVQTNPPLNGLIQPGVFTEIHPSDSSKTPGCKNEFKISYLNSNGISALSGTLFSTDTIPVQCCNLPDFCGEKDGVDALKTMISQALPVIFSKNQTKGINVSQQVNSFFNGVPPLYYKTILRDDTSGNISGIFYTTTYTTKMTDTLCMLNLYSENLPLTPLWDTTGTATYSLQEIIPLMSDAQADGSTYTFALVYKVFVPGKGTRTDTLRGESCIPLLPCWTCNENNSVPVSSGESVNLKTKKKSNEPENRLPITDYRSPLVNSSSDGCFNLSFPDSIAINFYDPCQQELLSLAILNAQNDFKNYEDSLRAAFYKSYKMKCLGAKEKLQAKYVLNEYQYTLYYYNQAGNLVRTVPPKGVRLFTNSADIALVQQRRAAKQTFVPPHEMTSDYRFNSLNAERKRNTPDGGKTETWYDELGRIVMSQNANQNPGRYSYTLYDQIGRTVETGEATVANIPASILKSQGVIFYTPFKTWLGTKIKKQVTKTYYDIAAFNFPGVTQENLRGRVSSATIDDDGDNNYEHATNYSYDIHGNVKTLIQDAPSLPAVGGAGGGQPKFKRIDYSYDLVSGKVKTVAYQQNQPDAFYHFYEYDAANRLKQVFTATATAAAAAAATNFDSEAKYYYFLHGPLARLELGERQVQGTDYAYTINGWLKGINSETLVPERDMGKDGNTAGSAPPSGGWGVGAGNPNRFFARDVFGYGLHYFDNDFSSVGQIFNLSGPITGGLNYISLYNGNIGASVTALTDLSAGASAQAGTMEILANCYRYDQLNRLKEQIVNNGLDKIQNVWGAAYPPFGGAGGAFYNAFTYDANGNILNLLRNASGTLTVGITNANGNSQDMDSLTYHYKSNNNQLRQVRDAVGAGNYKDDIDDQADPDNYQYDNIGNLVKDKSEEIDAIEWNVYGKVKSIKRIAGSAKPNLFFSYDAAGNRVLKGVITSAGDTSCTYYTRDAQGNIMATYTLTHDTFLLDEQIIYGSSRIGVIKRNKILSQKTKYGAMNPELIKQQNIANTGPAYKNTPPPPTILPLPFPTPNNKFEIKFHTLGAKRYELSNWLGNVNVVISDKKFGVDSTGDGIIDFYRADVRSAVDYFAEGMLMPGRIYNPTEYRFGMNTQEKADEISGSGNHYTAEFWEYDARTVRRWNRDRVNKPWESPYAAFSNNPIWFSDPNGKDSVIFFDQESNPDNKRVYTATVYVVKNNDITGPYSGSTFPNYPDADDSQNTLNEGWYNFNNTSGHKGGTKKGLNIVDENGSRQNTPGTDAEDQPTTMWWVNVHSGVPPEDDPAELNRENRGSAGCPTINPSDASNFFNKFTWTNTAQTTGTSEGKVGIFRGESQEAISLKNFIDVRMILQSQGNFGTEINPSNSNTPSSW